MTSLTRPLPSTESSLAPSGPLERSLGWRILVAVTALAGVGSTVYGVSTPWLSTFAGMLSQSGWGTHNGDILLVLSATAAVIAILQAMRASTLLRWALALTGFAIAGYSGYLLIQLYGVTSQLDGMVLAAKGPGHYFVAAGGLLVLATIFLPLPQPEATERAEPVGRTSVVTRGDGVLALRPLRSRLRYPAAALAVVAGLAHVPVTPQHLQEARYIGVLFIVFTVISVLTGTALFISDVAPAWIVLGVSSALAVAAYLASRSIGLPSMADDIGNWLEPLGVLAAVTESLAVVLSAVALVKSRRHSGRPVPPLQ